MKFTGLFTVILLLSIGCQQQAENVTNTSASDASTSNSIVVQPSTQTVNVRDTFDCKVYGKMDKTSDRWIAEKEMYFAMSNDIFQEVQPKFTSYNVFQVYNTLNCNLINNGKLPEVEGVAKPYKLQSDIYEPINQVVCAQSSEMIYCYHVRRKETLKPLNAPVSKAMAGKYDPNLDRDLTIWDHYIFGWTDKIGVYAYDLNNLQNPTFVKPAGTYSTSDNTNYFYYLKTANGIQVLVSEVNDGVLTMHPIFSKPMPLKRRVTRNKPGGRFAAFKLSAGNEFVAVDLAERKMISIPAKHVETAASVKSYLQTLN